MFISVTSEQCSSATSLYYHVLFCLSTTFLNFFICFRSFNEGSENSFQVCLLSFATALLIYHRYLPKVNTKLQKKSKKAKSQKTSPFFLLLWTFLSKLNPKFYTLCMIFHPIGSIYGFHDCFYN